MVRKTRTDKKDTICERCGHECSTPQKLREHLKWKNPCKPLQKQKEHERSEKDLEFREQEELGTAVKRRAVAVHRAKVPKSYPDNGSDIRKMLESQRKQFREILEKEFDKREQFKFALCSLTKFLIDDKPGNEKQEKKNSRTDWLRNKQIIVYNRAEIDDYISDAFEQILYQVEERGGRSNAWEYIWVVILCLAGQFVVLLLQMSV